MPEDRPLRPAESSKRWVPIRRVKTKQLQIIRRKIMVSSATGKSEKKSGKMRVKDGTAQNSRGKRERKANHTFM